ncbi:2-hydroxyacyl-CoA dehydratase subunit D [Thermodesulfobacteriota bacterium]
MPEELIVAAGAIPLCLIEGGDTIPLEASSSEIPNIFCPFARALVGERLLKRNPYYNMIDMLIAPITCQHLRKVADIWEFHHDQEIFKLGIPHQCSNDFEIEYYMDRLKALKERIEKCTGNEITDEKIGNAIELYNRIRALLRKISLIRCNTSPPIDTIDFVKLNHLSFYADPVFMVDFLESVYNDLRNKRPDIDSDAPRLLLIAPNIAFGDYKTLELIKETGGNIVIEEVYEGIRNYWSTVNKYDDLFKSLAEAYLRDRLPPAFMRYSSKPRFDFALKLIEDFNVSGVIWYGLQGCETYDQESFFFKHKLVQLDIPMLILESDYGMTGTGQVRTRIEAFMEMVSGELES